MIRQRLACGLLASGILLHAQGIATAQTMAGRVALEAIAAASSNADTVDDPFVVLELVGTVRIHAGWDVVVRPWARRLPGGDWAFEMYQLQARYVSSSRIPLRLDAGILPSPLGLSTLELQPHRNPLISMPFYYFTPLPRVDGQFDRLQLMSGGYPVGALVSLSGSHWDARAGVVDSTPALARSVFREGEPDAKPQVVFGGGITPTIGLRLGAGFSRGRYASRTAAPQTAGDSRRIAVLNLEGEYAIGHTRISGEWTRTAFDTPLSVAVARGFNLQGTRTLLPRLFAAARATHVSSPVSTVPVEVRRSSSAVEAVLGYRITAEVTVRGGYRQERRFQNPQREHSAIMSLVWAERWW